MVRPSFTDRLFTHPSFIFNATLPLFSPLPSVTFFPKSYISCFVVLKIITPKFQLSQSKKNKIIFLIHDFLSSA